MLACLAVCRWSGALHEVAKQPGFGNAALAQIEDQPGAVAIGEASGLQVAVPYPVALGQVDARFQAGFQRGQAEFRQRCRLTELFGPNQVAVAGRQATAPAAELFEPVEATEERLGDWCGRYSFELVESLPRPKRIGCGRAGRCPGQPECAGAPPSAVSKASRTVSKPNRRGFCRNCRVFSSLFAAKTSG